MRGMRGAKGRRDDEGDEGEVVTTLQVPTMLEVLTTLQQMRR